MKDLGTIALQLYQLGNWKAGKTRAGPFQLVAVDDELEHLVVGRTLGPEAALVGLGYGEHFDVVDAVAAAGTRRGARRQHKVLILGHT